jgi:hypothetical protein
LGRKTISDIPSASPFLRSRRNLRNLAKDLFASTYSFSYSELIKRMVDTGLNENNAKKRFKQLNNDNLILKEEVSGVWILNQNEFI